MFGACLFVVATSGEIKMERCEGLREEARMFDKGRVTGGTRFSQIFCDYGYYDGTGAIG